ncbi:MAG: hypothetical protein CBC48_09990 [bacterium TMED88]|nr:hypothetical protein [Deltaproteobacteria bacterium]OUV31077.1 MAG: hypothetical protein CBC48_09990 [bacterium TMED88]
MNRLGINRAPEFRQTSPPLNARFFGGEKILFVLQDEVLRIRLPFTCLLRGLLWRLLPSLPAALAPLLSDQGVSNESG